MNCWKTRGTGVSAAANGAEALGHLRAAELPCVILLDLMMPVMDGWEFRRRQQEDPRLAPIPVVVITAAGDHRASSISVQRILPKPLHLDAVLDALLEYC